MKPLLKNGDDPVVLYLETYFRLSSGQRKALEAVYPISDSELIGGRRVHLDPIQKALKWGAEWLRYKRMLERGETWPEEYHTDPELIEFLKRAIRLTPRIR